MEHIEAVEVTRQMLSRSTSYLLSNCLYSSFSSMLPCACLHALTVVLEPLSLLSSCAGRGGHGLSGIFFPIMLAGIRRIFSESRSWKQGYCVIDGLRSKSKELISSTGCWKVLCE